MFASHIHLEMLELLMSINLLASREYTLLQRVTILSVTYESLHTGNQLLRKGGKAVMVYSVYHLGNTVHSAQKVTQKLSLIEDVGQGQGHIYLPLPTYEASTK